MGDANGLASQAVSQHLSGGQLFSGGFFKLSTFDFEFLQRRCRGTTCLAGRDQEVAGVSRLDIDDVTQVAELADFFQKNDLHVVRLKLCVDRSTAPTPGSEHA